MNYRTRGGGRREREKKQLINVGTNVSNIYSMLEERKLEPETLAALAQSDLRRGQSEQV